MSYYLKYRPQIVGELDLVAVRQAFERILRSGEFSHAYLFYGPKGTGKTSSARILAKILNCEKNRRALETRNPSTSSGRGREPGTRTNQVVEPCGAGEG